MPRRKLTRATIDKQTAAELPEITDNQRLFVERLLAGDSASDAYRAGFGAENYSQNALWVQASRLRHSPNICLWLAAARKACLGSGVVTLTGHVQELERLREIAIDSGNVGAAVQAEVFRGRATGHYVEQFIDLTPKDPMNALREIAKINPQVAEQLATAMGVKWIEQQPAAAKVMAHNEAECGDEKLTD